LFDSFNVKPVEGLILFSSNKHDLDPYPPAGQRQNA